MIKVLILNDILIKGGKERRIVELLKYCKQHFDISFEIIFMYENVDFPEIYDTQYPIHIINWSNKNKIEGLKKIFAITKSFKPDILHSWSSMTDIISIFLKLYTRKKFISSMIAETIPLSSYKNKDYLRSKISFKFANSVTSNTKAGLLSYKAPISKSICIYNGFNYDRVKNLEDPELLRLKLGVQNKFIVGMVAAFAQRKDFETVILAAKSILKKQPEKIVFLLIGAGPLLNNMISLAAENAHKEIIFTGMINNVEEYINILDIGILCTNSSIHGEGISNSILEYMALGKPVIATKGGGTGEIVLNFKTGYLIPAKNPGLLEEKIIAIINQPHQANTMGLLGRQRIKEYFTIESMCNSFYNLYIKLLNN